MHSVIGPVIAIDIFLCLVSIPLQGLQNWRGSQEPDKLNIDTEVDVQSVQRSGVKIPNAVIASGLTKVISQNEQVIDYLKRYSKIERFLVVNDPSDELYPNLIIG